MLENYYSKRNTVCYRSAEDDVRGEWLQVSARGESPVASFPRSGPVPEPLCQELAHMQDAFIREWLFYRDDPVHAEEDAELRERELPTTGLNIRPKKLNKLQTDAPVWTYTSPGADLNVISFLAQHWTLDALPETLRGLQQGPSYSVTIAPAVQALARAVEQATVHQI